MINTKYYIYLMITIFLALGLGMMIGIALENKNIIENQQTLMINQIEERILHYRAETESLNDEITSLKTENEQLHSITDILFNEATANQLANMNIALVSFDNMLDNTYIVRLLEHSGALIQSNIVFNIDDISEVFYSEALETITNDYNELIGLVIDDIAYSLNFGGVTPLVQEIQDLGIIKNELDFESPVDTLIIISGGKSTSFYDSLLIDNIIESSINVVVVESDDIEQSAMEGYMSFDISTIDNIDTLYGRLSLISILIGSSGNYGIGTHSEALFPDPLLISNKEMTNDYEHKTD